MSARPRLPSCHTRRPLPPVGLWHGGGACGAAGSRPKRTWGMRRPSPCGCLSCMRASDCAAWDAAARVPQACKSQAAGCRSQVAGRIEGRPGRHASVTGREWRCGVARLPHYTGEIFLPQRWAARSFRWPATGAGGQARGRALGPVVGDLSVVQAGGPAAVRPVGGSRVGGWRGWRPAAGGQQLAADSWWSATGDRQSTANGPSWRTRPAAMRASWVFPPLRRSCCGWVVPRRRFLICLPAPFQHAQVRPKGLNLPAVAHQTSTNPPHAGN